MAKQIEQRRDDYLKGHRLTEKLADPKIWISHPSWSEAPDNVPQECKFIHSDYEQDPIPLPFRAFSQLLSNFEAEARKIGRLNGEPRFYDSWYQVKDGLCMLRCPHTLRNHAYRLLVLYPN